MREQSSCVNPSTSRSDDSCQCTTRKVVYGVTVGVSALKLLRGQMHWISSKGWEVVLVTSPDSDAKTAADKEGIDLAPIGMSRDISLREDLVSLSRWIRLLGQLRPSVLNVSTPKAGLLGGIAGWLRRIPKRIYVVRGLRLEGTNGIVHVVLWLTEWLSMKVATDVIFVSHSLAREARRRKLLRSKKSWVIGAGSSNGVDARAIQERISTVGRHDVREFLNLGSDKFVVGFIGRIAKDKGIETLAAAFSDPALNSRVQLLCIGATEDEGLNAILTDLGGRVRFAPWTDDVWGYLPAIDLLCLPTLREGFPNVILEAAAAGIPAVTTRATGAVDSVIDLETGYLIDVGDASGLVARINLLAVSPETVDRLGKAARERVEVQFQQEKIWEGVSEIMNGSLHPSYAKRVQI